MTTTHPRERRKTHSTSAGHGLRKDIEGLRAVAVGTVLLYHAGLVNLFQVGGRSFGFDGGYAGVDVFFVISGFLITSLLLREVDRTGTVSIANFYARRARRLLPAASIVLVFTALAGWAVLPVTQLENLSKDVGAATVYIVNWTLAARSVDYLAEDAAVSPVQHYWSLSVEEQFYVVWPLLMLLILMLAARAGWRHKRVLGVVLLAIFGVSLTYSVLHTAADPATAYFYTTTRAWELAIGALVAFAAVRAAKLPAIASQVMSLAGLLMIAWATVAFGHTTPWPGSAALVPTVGTALVIIAGCAPHDTAAKKLLGLRPMVWIGGLSYSIYLWHWPLIVMAQTVWPEIRIRHLLVVAAASVLLAWITKHTVEDPIRFNKVLSATPWRAILAGLTMMAISLAAAALVWRAVPQLDGGLPTFQPTVSPSDGATASGDPTADPSGSVGATTLVAVDDSTGAWIVREDPETVYSLADPVYPPSALATSDIPGYYDDDCQVREGDPEVNTDCTYGDTGSDRVIAVVGDSKAGQWMSAIEAIAEREGMRVDLYLKSACPFSYVYSSEAECETFVRGAVEEMGTEGNVPELVITSTSSARYDDVAAGMSDALGDLAALGADVVILDDTPYPDTAPVYECMAENPEDFTPCLFPEETPPASANLQAIADDGGYSFVSLLPWVCPADDDGRCPVAVGGIGVWRQGSHITDAYARTITPILHRELSALGVTDTPVDDITVDDIPEE